MNFYIGRLAIAWCGGIRGWHVGRNPWPHLDLGPLAIDWVPEWYR